MTDHESIQRCREGSEEIKFSIPKDIEDRRRLLIDLETNVGVILREEKGFFIITRYKSDDKGTIEDLRDLLLTRDSYIKELQAELSRAEKENARLCKEVNDLDHGLHNHQDPHWKMWDISLQLKDKEIAELEKQRNDFAKDAYNFEEQNKIAIEALRAIASNTDSDPEDTDIAKTALDRLAGDK